MSNSPLPIIAGLLGAGILGGLVATYVNPASVDNSAPTGAVGPAVASTSEVQVEQLTTQIMGLTNRIAMLESMPAASTRVLSGESPLTIPEEQIAEAVAAALSKSSGSGGLTNIVADQLDTIRAEEEVQREIDREIRREDALQARVTKLTEELALYPDQASEMLTILTDEKQKSDDLRDLMRAGEGDFNSFRTLKEETGAAVALVLTAEQLEQYNESNTGGRGPSGGRRGGGGGQ